MSVSAFRNARLREREVLTGAAISVAAMLLNSSSASAALVGFQGFEGNASDNWNYSINRGAVSTAAGGTDNPANQRILTGTHSFQVNNAASVLTFDSLSLADYTSAYITVRLSSTSATSNDGSDPTDYVHAFVALNGNAFGADSANASEADIALAGGNASRWGYDATKTATTTAGTRLAVTATANTTSTNNYSTFRIDLPTTAMSAALRLNILNNNNNEIWSFDDVSLFATAVPKDLTFNPPGRNFNSSAANKNFVKTTAGTSAAFLDGDTVRFTDAGVGSVAIDPAGVAPAAVFVSHSAGTYTFTGGSITGGTALAKSGAGILELTSPNAYAGGTKITGGTLLANDLQNATGSGAVDVEAGGTLGGTGKAGGTVNVKQGGTLSPGSGAGTVDTVGQLTTGDETWGPGGSIVLDLSDAVQDLILGDNLIIAATGDDRSTKFNIDVVKVGPLTPNAWFTIGSFNSVSGFDVDNFAVPDTYAIRMIDRSAESKDAAAGSSFDLQISAVPEPSQALVPIALAGIGVCRGRRRNAVAVDQTGHSGKF